MSTLGAGTLGSGTLGDPLADVEAPSGLTGAGVITIAAPRRLSVRLVAVPPWIAHDEFTPRTVYKVGALAWGTSDGWQPAHYISRDHELIVLPAGDWTKLAYSFAPGVEGVVTELNP